MTPAADSRDVHPDQAPPQWTPQPQYWQPPAAPERAQTSVGATIALTLIAIGLLLNLALTLYVFSAVRQVVNFFG